MIWVRDWDLGREVLTGVSGEFTDGAYLIAAVTFSINALCIYVCFFMSFSVSALQWLCNADKKHHVPQRRLLRFFQTLYAALTRGARAVFQFYPQDPAQMEMITSAAMKSGFTGGLVVDYPNSTKAKKMFLCLFAGVTDAQLPQGLGTGAESGVNGKNRGTIQYDHGNAGGRRARGQRVGLKNRDWVKAKKERARRQGKEVREDTRFTGRKRRVKF